mmetsp:Transcript_34710/g.53261  ORF Transcript_34710/g.53261 Transcript_34710/m.53261 type:complete len:86 (+) Transcript_34710:7837-8094(+)
MSDLDALNKKLKESMTVLDAVVPDRPQEWTPAMKTTFKTDADQSNLADELTRFRQERAQQVQTINPFASTKNLNLEDEDLAPREE